MWRRHLHRDNVELCELGDVDTFQTFKDTADVSCDTSPHKPKKTNPSIAVVIRRLRAVCAGDTCDDTSGSPPQRGIAPPVHFSVVDEPPPTA